MAQEASVVSPWSMISVVCTVGAILMGCSGAILGVFGGYFGFFMFLAAPVFALTGASAGFVAMRQIERGNGRVVGKPAALVGLFGGVGALSILGAGVVFAFVQFSGSKPLATVFADQLESIRADNFDGARAVLSEDARYVSDERLSSFLSTIESDFGAFESTSADFGLVFEAQAVFRELPDIQTATDRGLDANDPGRPVWLHTADDKLFVYLWVDQEAVTRGEVLIRDIIVHFAGPRWLLLRDDGPAARFAIATGVEWVEFDTELPDESRGSVEDGEDDGADNGG